MAKWDDRADELIAIECAGGHARHSMTARECSAALRAADQQLLRTKDPRAGTVYGYGDHVSDPRAVVMRYMTFLGWRHMPGGAMACPTHWMEMEGEDG